jgi:hypothetical protein
MHIRKQAKKIIIIIIQFNSIQVYFHAKLNSAVANYKASTSIYRDRKIIKTKYKL